jgi:hypothetical protein
MGTSGAVNQPKAMNRHMNSRSSGSRDGAGERIERFLNPKQYPIMGWRSDRRPINDF